ncbi:MAG: phenylacetate--CoA ligase family protein [Oscillospiraceae bacterium]|nr:phenylacetate--CoA ligase family protein [Oscillospiraceae bacterium]
MNGFTTADDIINGGTGMCRVSQKDIKRIVTMRSSGSTGPAKRLYFTEGDLESTADYFHRGMAHISPPGSSVAILLGSSSPDGLGALLAEGLSRLGARPFLHGAVNDHAEAAAFLAKLRPDVIVAAPVPLRRLALTLPSLRPAAVLLSSDYVADSLRQTVARVWDTAVYSHYGLTESGLGFAVQCSELEGHHIREDEFLTEIIDPDTCEPLPDGRWGEIVFTTLRREAMPLERYRTGDISRILPGRCACGRSEKRLDKILGRIDEIKKPVSIYTLDELLLGDDDILDYSASLHGAELRLEVVGNADKAADIISRALPRFAVSAAAVPDMKTQGKRRVILP